MPAPLMMRHQPSSVPPLPGVVQCRLAPAARRIRRGLPSARGRPSGAAGGAGDHAWGCAALEWPAALPGQPSGCANRSSPRGDGTDSWTAILGRGAAVPARRNPRGKKQRYLAHSNANMARWSLAGIFPEKCRHPNPALEYSQRQRAFLQFLTPMPFLHVL